VKCYPEGCAAPGLVPCQCNTQGSPSKLKRAPSQAKINVTSKSPVGDISVVTLIRTDTTLDHSQKAEKVWMMQNDVCDACPSRTTPDEYGCLQYSPQKCQPLERPKPDQSIHWMNPLGQMHSARDKNRTRQQKGLRDRNSPTCTLSQNGYGDNCNQTSEPIP
jgi:hypothetical protein